MRFLPLIPACCLLLATHASALAFVAPAGSETLSNVPTAVSSTFTSLGTNLTGPAQFSADVSYGAARINVGTNLPEATLQPFVIDVSSIVLTGTVPLSLSRSIGVTFVVPAFQLIFTSRTESIRIDIDGTATALFRGNASPSLQIPVGFTSDFGGSVNGFVPTIHVSTSTAFVTGPLSGGGVPPTLTTEIELGQSIVAAVIDPVTGREVRINMGGGGTSSANPILSIAIPLIAVPEPSGLAMIGCALLSLAGRSALGRNSIH